MFVNLIFLHIKTKDLHVICGLPCENFEVYMIVPLQNAALLMVHAEVSG